MARFTLKIVLLVLLFMAFLPRVGVTPGPDDEVVDGHNCANPPTQHAMHVAECGLLAGHEPLYRFLAKELPPHLFQEVSRVLNGCNRGRVVTPGTLDRDVINATDSALDSSLGNELFSCTVPEKTRADDVQVILVREVCEWADHLVIASGHSGRHLRGIADAICLEVKNRSGNVGDKVYPTVEVRESEEWM